MNEVANTKGFGRFTKHIILGSVISGVLCAIPILNCINAIFCLLNMAGIVFALQLYLKANQEDTISNGEAAGFGAAAGAGAGLISGVIGMLISLIFSGLFASLMTSLPSAGSSSSGMLAALPGIGVGGAVRVVTIPINIILYAAFGALGAFLGMQLFFKTRIRKD